MYTIPESVVLNKKGHKILSPEGLVSFYGINKIIKDRYIHLKFTNEKELKCSLDHPLSTIEGIIKAKDLDVYTEVYTKDGGCFLVESTIIEEKIELYDIVNSGTKHLYYSNNIVSHNCEFLGSINTLINPAKLKNLVYEDPIKRNAGLDIYEHPKEEHNYLITVDVARGMGNDYSAFIVFDITNFPYKVVGKYRNNEIKPMLFPSIINEVAKGYNNAWLLVEVNDIGDQVANILHFDLEYDNVLMCAMKGRAGQIVGSGFSGKKSQLGVRTTAAVKKLGCSNLKTLMEDDKLTTVDYDIISELTTFSQKHNSFEAEEGCNDDLAMCLVIFSWLVAQSYFKEMTDNDVRKRIYEEQKNQIEQDMAPFGFISDGLEDSAVVVDQQTGDRWMFATNENKMQTMDVWNVDEYGDRSYMWEYR
jgi:hypothetical protein